MNYEIFYFIGCALAIIMIFLIIKIGGYNEPGIKFPYKKAFLQKTTITEIIVILVHGIGSWITVLFLLSVMFSISMKINTHKKTKI